MSLTINHYLLFSSGQPIFKLLLRRKNKTQLLTKNKPDFFLLGIKMNVSFVFYYFLNLTIFKHFILNTNCPKYKLIAILKFHFVKRNGRKKNSTLFRLLLVQLFG